MKGERRLDLTFEFGVDELFALHPLGSATTHAHLFHVIESLLIFSGLVRQRKSTLAYLAIV